ncbi:MAG: ribbon-helix-helix protein, CopG family [Proteobacteria bacterium]|nr:ribbon-helix-helix protein, CopG family [Pseudomonadota bacterium]MBS0507716.1 ribbon-helix-helix protein, CopG family [Pseudomonadota bacterium]
MSTTVATSLKLPPELKAAIEEDARRQGLSSHAWMVRTLAEAAERARLREQFTEDGQQALQDMQASGLGHALDDVRSYFRQMAAYRAGRGERPAALKPQKFE